MQKSSVFSCAIFLVLTIGANAQTEYTLKRLSHLPLPGSFTTEVWGYVAPFDGREYALVGSAGLVIVDVSDPENPVQAAHLKAAHGFDIKIWQNYAYTVNGSGSRDRGHIINLDDPRRPEIVGFFPTAHNIWIDPNGYLYLEVPGLKIYDLNRDPSKPAFVWSDNDGDGHDAIVKGDTLIDFRGVGGTNIYNISNPQSPQLVSAIPVPDIAYSHSGWFDKAGRFLFICDEGARHPTDDFTIWDMKSLENPVKVGGYADADATVHNLYIIGDFAYVSYYSAGFRIFDVSTPGKPVLVAEYDTAPGNGQGAFGVYPFLPSANILVSDIKNGLFVFSFSGLTGQETPVISKPEKFILHENYPNPFNPATTIFFELPADDLLDLTIYNILGQPVRRLFSGVRRAGLHKIRWDGRDDSGKQVPAGVYLYTLATARFSDTKQMVLLR
jgi:choice-of-anchor B domain-containing protein